MSKVTIYTHDEAARLIDMFEDVLETNNIRVPSPEDDERDEDGYGLYGSTYSDLLDSIEEELINLLEKNKEDVDVVKYIFGGTI